MKRLNFKSSALPIIAFAIFIIAFATIARLLPHPPNFAPIAALALFGGLYLPRRWAIIAPIAALLVSDYFIGFYSWKMMIAVYGSLVLVGLTGLWVRSRKNARSIIGATLLGSILFFLITNAAVWFFGTMYAPDLSGLVQSYVAGLPFFRNTLAGDLFYVSLLVGSMEFVIHRSYTWYGRQKVFIS